MIRDRLEITAPGVLIAWCVAISSIAVAWPVWAEKSIGACFVEAVEKVVVGQANARIEAGIEWGEQGRPGARTVNPVTVAKRNAELPRHIEKLKKFRDRAVPAQLLRVEEAHRIPATGPDGTFSLGDLRRKIRILRGSDPPIQEKEIEALLVLGVTGREIEASRIRLAIEQEGPFDPEKHFVNEDLERKLAVEVTLAQNSDLSDLSGIDHHTSLDLIDPQSGGPRVYYSQSIGDQREALIKALVRETQRAKDKATGIAKIGHKIKFWKNPEKDLRAIIKVSGAQDLNQFLADRVSGPSDIQLMATATGLEPQVVHDIIEFLSRIYSPGQSRLTGDVQMDFDHLLLLAEAEQSALKPYKEALKRGAVTLGIDDTSLGYRYLEGQGRAYGAALHDLLDQAYTKRDWALLEKIIDELDGVGGAGARRLRDGALGAISARFATPYLVPVKLLNRLRGWSNSNNAELIDRMIEFHDLRTQILKINRESAGKSTDYTVSAEVEKIARALAPRTNDFYPLELIQAGLVSPEPRIRDIVQGYIQGRPPKDPLIQELLATDTRGYTEAERERFQFFIAERNKKVDVVRPDRYRPSAAVPSPARTASGGGKMAVQAGHVRLEVHQGAYQDSRLETFFDGKSLGIKALPEGARSISISADGKTWAVGAANGEILIGSAAHPSQWDLIRPPDPRRADDLKWGYNNAVSSVDFSPDGKRLMYANQLGQVFIRDITTGTETMIEPMGGVWNPQGQLRGKTWNDSSSPVAKFSPDGKRVVFVNGGAIANKTLRGDPEYHGVIVVDLEHRRVANLGTVIRAKDCAFSPDGRLVYVHNGAELTVLHADTGELLTQSDIHTVGDHVRMYHDPEKRQLVIQGDLGSIRFPF